MTPADGFEAAVAKLWPSATLTWLAYSNGVGKYPSIRFVSGFQRTIENEWHFWKAASLHAAAKGGVDYEAALVAADNMRTELMCEVWDEDNVPRFALDRDERCACDSCIAARAYDFARHNAVEP